MNRRHFLRAIGAASTLAATGPAGARIAQHPARRVIVDNDFAGDPDGLFALAHQMLSPKSRTVLVTSCALDPGLARLAGMRAGDTAAAGARLARELVRRLGATRRAPVATGAESFDAAASPVSAAARAIVAEAMRDDPLPLMLTCGGPLTNVAAALRLEPAIAGRMELVWIGGSSNPDGGTEYNLTTDLAAARHVLEHSDVPVWQVPEGEYKRFQMSVAELWETVRPVSPLAQWLCSHYEKLPPFVQLGGSLTLGDIPMVSLTAFDAGTVPHTVRAARALLGDSRFGAEVAGRTIRVCHSLDVRLAFADLRALLGTARNRR